MNNQILNFSQVERMLKPTGIDFEAEIKVTPKERSEAEVNKRLKKVNDRLAKVELFILKSKKPVDAKGLSKRFGVSISTAFKDIKILLKKGVLYSSYQDAKVKKYSHVTVKQGLVR